MLRLEPRAEASRLMSYLSPVLAAVLTLLAGMAIFSSLGKDPVEGLRLFLVNPVKDLYGISELLLKATPLMLCAIGLAVGFRANIWNIGAEGQFMLGTVGATGMALYFQESDSSLVLPAMVLAG
ncbi:MAG: ABC transporter permease, partial [Azoarcus sp.]|nr:ABC transporter permease [Azoarcus sp.]